MGDVLFLSDRRYGPTMIQFWQDGLVARAPQLADPDEWRACSKRLARKLGTTVRTYTRRGTVFAQANDGYPLGIIDPEERERWQQEQADSSPFGTADEQ